MKYYFKTHYTFASRRVGLIKRLQVPELISLAIVSEHGDHFFALNVDFSGRYTTDDQAQYIELLPSLIDRHWMRLRDIKKKLAEYILESSGESSEWQFNHYNDEIGCAIIRSLLIGQFTFRNVGQVVHEYVNSLQPDNFGPGSPYRLEKLRTDGNYSFNDKMEMFKTHHHYPLEKEYMAYSEQAVFIKHIDGFMAKLKSGYYEKPTFEEFINTYTETEE